MQQRPVSVVALPAQTVVARRVPAKKAPRAPAPAPLRPLTFAQPLTTSVDLDLPPPQWQFESGHGTDVFILYEDAVQTLLNAARDKDLSFVRFYCGASKHHLDFAIMLVSVNSGLAVKVQHVPWRASPSQNVAPAPPPAAPSQDHALPPTAAAARLEARLATMRDIVDLKGRFGPTHKRLLQDLVCTHGMDERGIQAFLEHQVGLQNAGAKYWLRNVHFDLIKDRRCMHAFVVNRNGQPLHHWRP